MPDSGFLGNQSLTWWGTRMLREVSWAGAAGGPRLDRASLHLESCFWSSAQSRGRPWGPHVCGRGPRWGRGLRSRLQCRNGPQAVLPVSASLCPHGTQVATCSVLCHLPASGTVTWFLLKLNPEGRSVSGLCRAAGALALSPRPPPLTPSTTFLLLLRGLSHLSPC